MNQSFSPGGGYGGGTVSISPASPSPILALVSELHEQSDYLANTIVELAQRLSAITRPIPPEPCDKAQSVPPTPLKSDHLYRLEDLLRKNKDSIVRVQEITGRLDI